MTVRPEKVSLWTYFKKFDYLLLFAGIFSALVHGAGFPLLSIVLGTMTNVFLRAQNSEWVVGAENVKNDTLSITQSEFREEIKGICVYYAILGVVQLITSYIQIAAFETLCEKVVHRIRVRYLKSLLRQEISWFDAKQTGNLTSRLTDDLERAREAFGDKLSLLIQNILACFVSFLIGFWYNWRLTLVMAVFVPPLALIGAWGGRFNATRTKIEQAKFAETGAVAEQALSSMRTVQALNAQRKELQRFNERLNEARRTSTIKYFMIAGAIGTMNLCRYASYAAAFWYAGRLISQEGVSNPGFVFTVFFAVMSGTSALSTALPFIGIVSTGIGAMKNVIDVISSVPSIDPYSTQGIKRTLTGNIQLSNVKFKYPSRPEIQILKGVSLSIGAGQKIALVGASGCGKSTIMSMMLRFYDPDEGAVFIDGINLREMNVASLREQVGIVSQEPILFDGTLLDNICLAKEDVTDKEIVDACVLANAWDFIKKLPNGLDTRVGERGIQLSGGQKQRIAIARALVREPKILLLDEATSALDTESEAIVQKALEQAQANRTVIMIAHRLSTIKNADKIFVFKDGNIVESGTHEELMQLGGQFHGMVTAQTLRQVAEAEELKKESTLTRQLTMRESVRTIASVDANGLVHLGSLENLENLDQSELEENLTKLKPVSIFKIFMFNKKAVPKAIIGYLTACLIGCCTPCFAILYAQIFSVFTQPVSEMVSSIYFWALMFLVLGVCHGLGSFTSNLFCGLAGEDCTKAFRYITFKSLMQKDIAYFDDERNGTGKLCTRLATDAPNVRYVFTRMPLVISSSVTIIASLTLAFMFGWKLTLCVIPSLPIIILAQGIQMKMELGNKIRDARLLEDAGKVAMQAIDHVRTVQALNKQEHFNAKYCEFLRVPHKENIIGAQYYGIVFGIAQAIIFFMYAVAFFLGSIFVLDGSMQPFEVYRVFFCIAFCGQMVASVATFMPDVVKTRLAAAFFFNIVNEKTRIDNLSDEGIHKELSGDITFNNIHFMYPTRPDFKVLKGFSLKIKAGQTVALVGHSGCGKSTSFGLLERFYLPERGDIEFDQISIDQLSLSSLRSQIGIVSQEPVLFDCTIRENIIYGMDRVPSPDEIDDALKLANAYNFIKALPQGIETEVGERGTQLSGGQKQRIAIARALIRKPKILLLDEATSALDSDSEKIVQEALEKARQGRTCLIIAHRLSTIQDADKIVVVHDGKVYDAGTHEELLQHNDIYKKLCATQAFVEADK